MTFDALLQRRIMGHFATGVTVIMSRCGERMWGMTANALLSLSLDPPLILVAVDRRNQMHACISEGKCFSINVLAADQEDISRRFATHGPKDFSGLAIKRTETGAPIFADALAFVDCRLSKILRGGDHDIFFGEPVAGEIREGEPLIFYGGQYTRLAPLKEISEKIYTLEDTFEHYGTF